MKERTAKTRRCSPASTPTSSRPMARRCCIDNGKSLVDRAAGAEIEPEAATAVPVEDVSRCGSTRAPSGRRSSTRPGASTATTSTPRTCTASTGTRCAKKYEAFLPALGAADLNRVSCSGCRASCAVGHSYSGGGDRPTSRRTSAGRAARRRLRDRERPLPLQEGLRRAELEPAAARRSPSRASTSRSRRIPARGRRQATCARPPTSTALFENTAGKIVEITVGPNADGTGRAHRAGRADRERARAAQPRLGRGQLSQGRRGDRRPRRLRLRAQHRAAGHAYFKRYFFPQVDKDAVIVDERFNGGGQVADYYIDILRRPFIATGRCATARTSRRRRRVDPGAEGDDHRRDGRLGRRPAAVDVPQVQARPARRQADLGRPGRHPRLPGADGRRHDHRAEPRDLDAGGRLGRRERGRAAGHRGRADAAPT